MKRPLSFLLLFISIFTLLSQGCAATAPQPFDYSAYLAHMPRSILVLPPLNQSTEVMAPYIYLSTVTRALAERGYYVYPVAVVDAMMKDNGVPTPAEMAQIPLKKIKEIINPDAVLYITIVEWGAKYQIVNTVTKVSIHGRLVDTTSGALLWEGSHTAVQDANGGNHGGGIVEMLLAALVEKIITNISDPTREVSYRANYGLFNNPSKGLLTGRYNAAFEQEQNRLKTSHLEK